MGQFFKMSFIKVLTFLGIIAAALGCGKKLIYSGRVIGGQNARHGEWPWQVLLYDNNGRPFCGGSILGPRHILTAAHCVYYPPTRWRAQRLKQTYEVNVRVGDNNWSTGGDSGEASYYVKRIYAHREFNFRHLRKDIAVLVLQKPIRFNTYVQPICLPSAPAQVGQECWISGWGRIDRGLKNMHPILQQAKMPVINTRTCAYAMQAVNPNIPVGSHSLCAGHGDTRISGCQGDSGGPFVCFNKNKNAWELQGAVSWGSRDCSASYNTYTVFANVYNLKRWVQYYMQFV